MGGATLAANVYIPAGTIALMPVQAAHRRSIAIVENIAPPESSRAGDDTEPPAVLTLRGETPPPHGETTPFTDDNFDKLIEDIEELIDDN